MQAGASIDVVDLSFPDETNVLTPFVFRVLMTDENAIVYEAALPQ